MLINPFQYKSEISIHHQQDILPVKQIDIPMLQQELIMQHRELLQKDKKEDLKRYIEAYSYQTLGIKDQTQVQNLIQQILDKIFGYGILQPYIEDTEVTDIRVVKFCDIYVKRLGKWEKIGEQFVDEEDFIAYIRYCIVKNNANINFDTPIITVSDKQYHLRIEAGILPVNAISPSLVIRIHRPHDLLTLEKLQKEEKMMTKEVYRYLLKKLKQEKNIIIAGKGGSGKTTLLRALLAKIPEEKAITINEETTELYLQDKNVIQREILHDRKKEKQITLEQLMQHALVMSNDIIVVGELKGVETSSFMDAISTGHQGFATVHASHARGVIPRLVTLLKRDSKTRSYQEEFMMSLLKESIDCIIYLEDYKITEIIEVETNLVYGERKYVTVYTRKRGNIKYEDSHGSN